MNQNNSANSIDPDEFRAELARRNWTQKFFAAKAGLSPAYISAVCAGLRPSERARSLILEVLGSDGARRVSPQTDRGEDES